jgi:hypothetical protein
MAKTKAAAKKKASPARLNSIRIRMTDEFKAWVEAVSSVERLTVAAFIERAIVDTAKRNGHPTPPGR